MPAEFEEKISGIEIKPEHMGLVMELPGRVSSLLNPPDFHDKVWRGMENIFSLYSPTPASSRIANRNEKIPGFLYSSLIEEVEKLQQGYMAEEIIQSAQINFKMEVDGQEERYSWSIGSYENLLNKLNEFTASINGAGNFILSDADILREGGIRKVLTVYCGFCSELERTCENWQKIVANPSYDGSVKETVNSVNSAARELAKVPEQPDKVLDNLRNAAENLKKQLPASEYKGWPDFRIPASQLVKRFVESKGYDLPS